MDFGYRSIKDEQGKRFSGMQLTLIFTVTWHDIGIFKVFEAGPNVAPAAQSPRPAFWGGANCTPIDRRAGSKSSPRPPPR
jgi:hypothetical protein